MAPLRRYLRITKYSVLECRIYVDNPALVRSWLLHPRDPVLPRVIESVRPLVLPKLMEERERAKKKGAKNKGAIRDVLVEDDFEVSLFLTETNTRHSLLYKHRRARDKTQTRLVSNSTKLTGGTSDAPIDVDDGGGAAGGRLRVEMDDDGRNDGDNIDDDIVLTAASTMVRQGGQEAQEALEALPRVAEEQLPPNLLLEDSDDEVALALDDIPDIQEALEADVDRIVKDGERPSKRRRQQPTRRNEVDKENEEAFSISVDQSDSDSLFASGDEGDVDTGGPPPTKRMRTAGSSLDDAEDGNSKKKKLAMDVIYEGFAIYGRVLCLVVKQRGSARSRTIRSMLPGSSDAARSGSAPTPSAPAMPAGQAAMENWIASTQIPREENGV